MARMGMDVDQVASAGKALKERAAEIDALVSKLEGIVRSIPGTWEGPDAQQFVNEWWPEHKKTLVAASSHVAGLGQSALNNASEQREVSGSSGGGGGSQHSSSAVPDGSGNSNNNSAGNAPKDSIGSLPPVGREDYVARIGNPVPERLDGLGAYTGNCTSWAAFRRKELGLPWLGEGFSGTGHGYQMAERLGGSTTTPPTLGAVVSSGGPPYGHVMVIEEIRSDGSFRVSEMNVPDRPGGGPVLGHVRSDTVFTPAPGGGWTSSRGGGAQALRISP